MTTAPRHGRGRRPAEEVSGVWRLPVLVVVLAVLVGAGLLARAVSVPVAPPAPTTAAAVAAPAGAQSSTWYCAGGSGTASGVANATLYLTNATRSPVSGTVKVVNSDGATAARPVTVAAGSQQPVVPSAIEQGTWLASQIELDGGGVTVSEAVTGPAGWAQSACSTTTASNWYFASGATTNGSTPYVDLFNPTTTAAVVDLAFVTSKGVTEPQPFEGIQVAPGHLVVATVASFVQDQASVGTVVDARTGQVVATELEEHVVDGVSGLSLQLGAPALSDRWYVPRTVDVTDGAAAVTVLNPASVAQRVTVQVQLKSGPVAPFTEAVPANASWTVTTSQASRIPTNTTFAVTVTATGGPGVVVDRTVQSSTAGAVPQWGTVVAVGAPSTVAGSGQWVVPSPAVPATPPVSGATALALGLQNVGARTVTVTVYRLTPQGARRLTGVPILRIPPRVFTVIEPNVLAAADADPLVIRATGPVAAMEDAQPAGVPGAVALAAVPQG